MTRKTYCGNLLWQSGLTLLAPAGHVSTNANARAWLVVAWDHAAEEPHAAAHPDSVIAPPTVLP